MSLNNTEKNSLDYIESLVTNVEKTINEEFRKWSMDSGGKSDKTQGVKDEGDEAVEIKDESKK